MLTAQDTTLRAPGMRLSPARSHGHGHGQVHAASLLRVLTAQGLWAPAWMAAGPRTGDLAFLALCGTSEHRPTLPPRLRAFQNVLLSS